MHTNGQTPRWERSNERQASEFKCPMARLHASRCWRVLLGTLQHNLRESSTLEPCHPWQELLQIYSRNLVTLLAEHGVEPSTSATWQPKDRTMRKYERRKLHQSDGQRSPQTETQQFTAGTRCPVDNASAAFPLKAPTVQYFSVST